jgi:hypothetical protein
MPVRLLDRALAPAPAYSPLARPAAVPDAGYESLPRLEQLRDQLTAAAAARQPGPWKEPPVFFFNRRRQAEYEAARPNSPADPFAELAAAINVELHALFASVEVRRIARALDGLRGAAEAVALVCPPARDLADLLAVPDDEVVVVLHPARRAGFRLAVRGVADVGQFHVLLADAVTGDPAAGYLPGPPVAARFVSACRDVNPAATAGVPMAAAARYQLYTPSALRRDGNLPDGFGGCEHWLWPATPMADVPRVGGERVVLLGPPAFAASWEVTRRFPELAAGVRVIETLGPARVAEWLARLAGRPLPDQPEAVLSRAA